jgi:signal peptide peptidase SppA
MKNLNRIINAVYNEKWLIKPSVLHSISKQLETILAGDMPLPGDSNNDVDEADDVEVLPSKTAVICIDGVIGKHLSLMETSCGGVDLDNINAQLDEVGNNPEIETVILYFNTPGGTVTGVPECGERIAELASKKTVIGYADVLCASAGYWLASQCNAFYCAASADIGSINVYCLLLDESQALANAGIKVNAIVGSNGKYKLAGASFKPLTDEEKAMFQADINKTESQFFTAVTSKRAVAIEDMTGACFDGETAVTKNLADGNIASLDELLTFLESQN